MTDVLFVVILIGFFAAFAGFVVLCGRIIGPDPALDEPQDRPAEVAA